MNHDTTVKSNFVPAVTFNIDIPTNPNLGSFYDEDVHVVTKDSAIHPTSAVRQIMEIGLVLKDKLEQIIFLFNNADDEVILIIVLIEHNHPYHS